ncbi:cold shock domain-containing protein [Streptomyces sp. SL13]|jgi:CspA family cold shock protein|uniref:Cold shock domain-containing protein n=1 Tax=Streptantibioticus silvisoli TaxID=2705255 RepID=A0AA90GVL9_9ACTN|nr:cold shock domain-containing protein [Streptantibioticus silvisoli]MDI5965481.1 cold shock domain-containing protein [Streptantibioticus silvisoli]MDI5968913.1 cold shock domain-containing protein [Streptantibioticus silvisoli]
MQNTGKILRFDETRGYGFIAPENGDEDVFVHANDLLEEKYLYRAGRAVEFFVESGEKGPKASEVRLIRTSTASSPFSTPVASIGSAVPAPEPAERSEPVDGALCDVLSAAELSAELTEVLLAADETLTARQIKQVRSCFLALARSHSWTDV